MKSKLEQLYYNCPPIIQNAAISLIGLKENHLRYSGVYKEFFNDILKNQRISIPELKNLQEKNLKNIIYTAASNVPYYSKLFEEISFPKEQHFKFEDVQKIPILVKSQIKEKPTAFISSKYKINRLLKLYTSGTTGSPLRIYCTPEVRQKNYAFFSRFLQSVGINPLSSKATIGGRIFLKPDQQNPPFWRYSVFQKSIFFSAYHLTEDNMNSYLSILKKLKPNYIDAYPSSLYTIADYAQRNNLSMHGITKGIVTSAETLDQHKRKTIENVFGVPVFDQYGATEMCVFIAQCRLGQYHIHSDYSYVELLKDDGTEAEESDEADVVCTGFINHVMPLIRYKIGDKVRLSKKECECGSQFPVIDRISGRDDDLIITADGRKMARLTSVLKGMPIREAQYRQYTPGAIELHIVKLPEYTGSTELKIIEEIKKRTGSQMDITIKHVSKIEREKGGKLRTVISYLNNEKRV